MDKMWRKWGAHLTVVAGLVAIVVTAPLGANESLAAGTVLENGVRAWDRSNLNTKRPPRAGARRFAPKPKLGARGSTAPRRQRHAWFWQEMDPGLGAGGAERWGAAVDLLRARRQAGTALVSRSRLERVAERWASDVQAVARRHGISEALILAVIAVESSGNTHAVSPKGATGLMQLMPATGRRFGVTDRTNPAQNLAGGTAYLDLLLKRFRGDALLALAAYNAGENAVDRNGGVPPYAETRDYVVLVLDAVAGVERLCASPQIGPRDRCALRRVRAPRA